MSYIGEIELRLRKRVSEKKGRETTTPRPLMLGYAALVLNKGEDATAADVHNVWAAWAEIARPNSADLVWFAELEPGVAELDLDYVESVHEIAKELKEEL